MFHAIVERKVRWTFANLSRGDYEQALRGLAPRFEHTFAGDHALGGSRHTVAGFRTWFERLYRLFPNLDFEVLSVRVSGPLWDMVITAEWIDRATPAGGGAYENRGVHVIHMVRGRLASLHAYLDTQVLADTLRRMAAQGIDEAVAAPIGDPAEADADDRRARRSAVMDGKDAHRPAIVTGLAGSTAADELGIGALAIGALATGALAIGALAIGRLAVGQLTIGNARVRSLEIDDLVVRRTTSPVIDQAG